MISRYRVWLNDRELEGISPQILVEDIEHRENRQQATVHNRANWDGGFVGRSKIESVGVTIKLEIREYAIDKRQAICTAIAGWAKDGGKLQTNDRPGQYLDVVMDGPPVIPSALKWTDQLSVSFMAYDVPHWQEETPVEVNTTGTESKEEYVPGNAGNARVEIEATITEATDALTLTVDESTIILADLGASAGDVITIDYQDGIQRIRMNDTSILDKRTGSDDLLAECGKKNTFAVEGDANVSFTVRGVWM